MLATPPLSFKDIQSRCDQRADMNLSPFEKGKDQHPTCTAHENIVVFASQPHRVKCPS